MMNLMEIYVCAFLKHKPKIPPSDFAFLEKGFLFNEFSKDIKSKLPKNATAFTLLEHVQELVGMSSVDRIETLNLVKSQQDI